MLLAGRALEGLGAGALVVVTYASASRAYPPAMYGRMLALMSSAWVLPSLAGPAVAGLVADHTTWRWVFVLLLPFLPVAVALTLPGLRALARPERGGGGPPAAPGARARRRDRRCSSPRSRPSRSRCCSSLAAAGLALALPALRSLLPAGTLRAARGLPSGIAGARAAGGRASSAATRSCRSRSPSCAASASSQAGLVISAASLSWSLGSFLQARLDRRDGGAGRPRRLLAGLAVLLGGHRA